ncbi:hypothetical protein GCM10010371_26650 [Streptomyces subrutilus]|uniref:Tetratricopeptide repeat protein n=1 Tax=Streptomyces subrutilus TaxID=36818 RepID=A0A918QPF0_9ACTN|nr:hypothetical protein GCM10010371_26650 [Streptomyces subrutilus]
MGAVTEGGAGTAGESAVRELASLSGRAVPLLREWAAGSPRCGEARALLVLATSDGLGDAELRTELVRAHHDARAAGPRAVSLVHGVFLFAHRQYPMAADHVEAHLGTWPGDEQAAPMLDAFAAAGDAGHAGYRERGDALAQRQYALAGPESWVWAGRLAWVRAEQGRPYEAYELAASALARNPRAGLAVHAKAHAEQDTGAGPASTAFIDRWLAGDPRAVQFRHLNWHAALQSLAAGDFADARRRADRVLDRADVGMRASTNWRLLLAGQAPARRCELGHVRELLAAPEGTAEVFHTFNLALALAVEAATDDLTALARRAAADGRSEFSQVLAPVVRALAHLTAGRPDAAVDLLAGLGRAVERLGGVRVEREIVQDTLARALVDAGDPGRAAGLLHRRRAARRHHVYEDLLVTAGAARTPAPAPTPNPVPRETLRG